MNHAYYLAKMPQALRAQIEAETVYYPWLRQGETLESIWSKPELMEIIFKQLSVRERSILTLIVKAIGCEPFDSARLEKLAASSMSGAEVNVGFIQLLKKGFVYPFRKSWGEHVYVMSQEGFGLWQRVLMPMTSNECGLKLPDDTVNEVKLTETNSLSLAHQLFHALVYIAQNDLKMTKNGTMHKKHMLKLQELLAFPDAWLEGTGIKYAYADVYSPKIAVLLEFMTRLQLIDLQSDTLRINNDKLERWLALSEESQTSILYMLWRQVVFPFSAWLQHAAIALERQEEGEWMSSIGLLKWLHRHGIYAVGTRPDFSDGVAADREAVAEAVQQLEQQWVFPLVAFGWLEKGTDSLGMAVYRWLKHPLHQSAGQSGDLLTEDATDDEGRFYVQPDFELLVPPEVGFAVRWELSVIADVQHMDQLSIYKLSKESTQRAMEYGRGIEDIIRFLEQFAMYGLPENVKSTLMQWSKPFGKVGLAHVLLLRCEDASVAEAIGKLPGSGDWLAEPVGERAWIVRPEQLNRITEQLSKAGWIPGKVVQLDGSAVPGGHAGAAGLLKPALDSPALSMTSHAEPDSWSSGQGFIYARHGIGYYDMEQRLPDVKDLYPDLNGIPSGWTKDYRAYHVSTRREIVEKAMEWRAGIQVRYQGHDHYVAPRKLQETRGTWSMIGLEQGEQQEVCWFPEEWQEMKIILPGINDKY